MKKIFLIFGIAISTTLSTTAFAQSTKTPTEITKKNSWLKVGLGAGLPVGTLSRVSNGSLNFDVKGQVLSSPHTGFGVTSGYIHYFPYQDNENFGSIPVGLFGRYYFKRTGLFLGSDVGYSFQTGSELNSKGGVYVKPQIGYHNPNWNFFGFYNGVFRGEKQGGHLQQIGVGATYNLMFK